MPKNKIYNKSLSSIELEKKRFENKLNLFLSNNKYIRKSIQFINVINPLFSTDKELKSKIKLIVKDYYKSDNQILKKLLPSIKWERYPNSYLWYQKIWYSFFLIIAWICNSSQSSKFFVLYNLKNY